MCSQLLAPRVLVVTNCTTRKRASTLPVSLSYDPMGEDLDVFAKRWVTHLAGADPKMPAGHLYLGRAFSDAKSVARTLDADLYVASAGLGLLSETDVVPNYNMSVGSGRTPLNVALEHTKSTPSQWWTALTEAIGTPQPLTALLESASGGLALLALPSNYLLMIRDDLAQVSATAVNCIRIFTSEAGRPLLPPQFVDCVLPYDERLESLPGYNGTRSDFPQRALRHFVEVLGAHERPLSDARRAVAESMARLTKRAVPARARIPDDQIVTMLLEKWSCHGGSSTRLLRYLRDDALIACEQGRFRDLWRQARLRREVMES